LIGFFDDCKNDLCPNGFTLFEVTPTGYFRDCHWKEKPIRKPIFFKQLLECNTPDELRDQIYNNYLEEIELLAVK